VNTDEFDEAAERVTGFLDHMFTPEGNGDVIRAYASGGVQYLLTEDDLRALVAGYKEMREQLTPREITCPACKRPTKLTTNGLIRYHGPHNQPCHASGINPKALANGRPPGRSQ